MRDLKVFYSDNGVFSDLSNDMRDYLRDDNAFTFVAAEDYIYVGLHKPFYAIYAEFETASAADPTLDLAISTGAAFSSISFTDDTKGFTRSGFVRWDREMSTWAQQSVNSESQYWLRIGAASDFTMTVRGINVVFSDDTDLQKEMRSIDNFKSSGDSSFIAYHVSARDEIVQSMRNAGRVTMRNDSENLKEFTQWDFLDIDQVRNASKYLTLAKIMFDVSTNPQDKYYERYKDFIDKYAKAFDLYLLWYDSDDDGEMSQAENRNFRSVGLFKI